MATKSTVQDLKDAGFVADMFGPPTNFDAYLQAVVDDATARVTEAVGATPYADATDGSYFHVRLVAAEVAYASAVLWRRYKQFLVAQSNKARSDEDGPRLQKQAEANAQAADKEAADIIAEIGGTSMMTRPGIAVGYVESGPFTAVAP